MKDEYRDWVQMVADEIADDEPLDVADAAWEAVDGSEYVIYYGKATALVADADTGEIDAAYEDSLISGVTPQDYWSLQSHLAFHILYARLCDALQNRGLS